MTTDRQTHHGGIYEQFMEAMDKPLVLRYRGSVIPKLIVPVALLSLYSFVFVFLHSFGLTFTLSSALIPTFSLVTGLLVSFRTGSAYDRWWEGRRLWSTLTGNLRNFGRILWLHVEDGPNEFSLQQKREALNLLSAYALSIKHHLREEKGTSYQDINDYLPKRYLAQRNMSGNLPLEISYLLNRYIDSFVQQKRLEPSQVGSMNGLITSMVDCLGSFERIARSPIPLAYQIHLRQLLTLYCVGLTPQLVDTLGYGTVIVTAFVTFAFFGVDYIGLEIENPFGYDFNDLPVERFCAEIESELKSLSQSSFNPHEMDQQ